ncbi:putative nitrogen fixation protein [Rhodobacter aestuarii]|uniref:Probable nitrogen fixation protein n=1 Tax=Rhodobacter aestuarii TaxID=453582 RepID=A0A1N7NSD5_9RHOB|nr:MULTISPECIES: NifX-associated nitrogen fixation protein [Rhodobacter]PTV94578.1 putative nitrogen fixation protein [Rhodobacter aestuarii]SIT01244.1 probable nitrogen fixation protein [Rhodobacter aestuarii]SOC12527.1 probable nitrogen fixation protein [Rhodobacter sp. JA431]
MDTETEAPRGGEMVESPFLKQLVAVIRAEDTHGQWDNKTDIDLLEEFIITKEERREMPIIGDPEPEVIWRLTRFYDAVGLLVEKRSGCMATQMQNMHHEGFGRVVLIAGRLVVVSKHLRDVHRFGFETWAKLAQAGEKLVDDAVKLIEEFPEAAKA